MGASPESWIGTFQPGGGRNMADAALRFRVFPETCWHKHPSIALGADGVKLPLDFAAEGDDGFTEEFLQFRCRFLLPPGYERHAAAPLIG